MTIFTRRRFLSISAAMTAMPALAAAAPVATWRGRALGGLVSMKLAGLGATDAAPIFNAVEQELSRLENIFSLYRTESQISRLNREGVLKAPAPELLQVLAMSDRLNEASNGLFDPTIQTLWMALAQGKTGAELESARALVGWQGVRFDTQAVHLREPGQAVTLNGVAQGFVTDRIAALLKAQGLRDVLLDMGEVAALGQADRGRAWKVGVADPDGTLVKRMTLQDRALATSAPKGTALGDGGHILNPKGAAVPQQLVSVSAPQAMMADGLSTALCLMSADDGQRLVSRFPGASIEVLA